MRILFLSNFYPPSSLGGMELRCRETVEHLRARGHTCHVLSSRFGVQSRSVAQSVEDGRCGDETMCNSPEGDCRATLAVTANSECNDPGMQSLPLHEEGVSRLLYLQADVHYYRPLDFFLRRPRQERTNRQALRQTLDRLRPDVIFIWGMWNLSRRVAYRAEQWMPGRVAYAIAGYWLAEPDVHESYWQLPAKRAWAEVVRSPVRRMVLRALARERQAYPLSLEQVACVSHYVRDKLTEAHALPHGARVIYSGIDPQPFVQAATAHQPSQDEMRLVYVGGLMPQKGIPTAIEALRVLRQQGLANGLRLTIVGGGHPAYKAGLKQRVGDWSLGEMVTFRGRVPRDQIADILASHDVFLFTSVYEEPLARTVMEAMAAGLAVIGTAVGGQGEMLQDGLNALIFAPEDPLALAEAILQIRSDPALRARLARAGRQMVLERFTLDRMVNEMETWLQDLAA